MTVPRILRLTYVPPAVSQIFSTRCDTRNRRPTYWSISGMNGTPCSASPSSRLARISPAGRTSTKSPVLIRRPPPDTDDPNSRHYARHLTENNHPCCRLSSRLYGRLVFRASDGDVREAQLTLGSLWRGNRRSHGHRSRARRAERRAQEPLDSYRTRRIQLLCR